MNDRSPSSADPGLTQQPPRQRPAPGDYLMNIEDVPREVREYAINRLAAGGGGSRDDRPNISVARENGSYYGPVILNNERFIVQAVGKDRGSAVVHPKELVELQGVANELNEKRRLNGFSVQVHYTGDRAKGYPYKPKEATADHGQQQESSKPAVKETMKPETVIAKAQEYAAENIKNAIQRATFLKHMEAATQLAFQPRDQQAQQATKAPVEKAQPAKQADTGIER